MATRGPSWPTRFGRGLNASVRGNAQAFGFSITVTVTFGVLSQLDPHPGLFALFLFAVSAVFAFSLLNLLVVLRHGDGARDEPGERATLVGTATDFLAVGCAVGCAIGVAELFRGTVAWVLAPFVSGMAYVLVQSVELAVGRAETPEASDG